MNERQLANASLSIFADLYMGVFDMFPDFTKIIQDSLISSYHEETVMRDIEYSNNATFVDLENKAQMPLEIKLQQKEIPFEKVTSSGLTSEIEVCGDYIFILRGIDYERTLEAVEELQEEYARNAEEEIDPEAELEENELERSREDEVNSEAEENADESDPMVRDDIYDDDDIEEDSEPEQKPDKKKKSSDDTNYEQKSREEQERRDRESRERGEEQRRRANDARQYDTNKELEQARAHEKDRAQNDARLEEQRRAGEKKQSEEHQKSGPHQAERSASQEGTRNKAVDYSNREIGFTDKKEDDTTNTGDSGISQKQNRISQKRYESREGTGIDRYNSSGNTEPDRSDSISSLGREAGNDREREYIPHRTQQNENSNTGRREAARHQAEQGVSQTATRNKSVDYGSRKTEYTGGDKATSLPSYHIPTDTNTNRADLQTNKSKDEVPVVKRTSSPERVEYRSAETQPQRAKDNGELSAGAKPRYLGNGHDITFSAYGTKNTTSHVNQIPVSATFGGVNRNNAFSNELLNHTNVKETYGRFSIGSEALRSMAVRANCENLNIRVSRSPRGKLLGTKGEGHSIEKRIDFHQSNDITHELLRQKSVNSVGTVVTSAHFVNILKTSKRLASQSVLGHDSDAGSIFRETGDVISPIGNLLAKNYLKNGAILLNKDIHLDTQVFASAYAAYSGCSIEDAYRQTLLMSKNALLSNGEKSGLNMQMMEDFVKKANAVQVDPGSKLTGFSKMLNDMGEQKFSRFLQLSNITDELKKKLLSFPMKELQNPILLDKLLKQFGSKNDQDFLKMLKGSAMSSRFRGASIAAMIQGYILQLFKRLSKQSDAGKAGADVYFAIKYTYGTYRTGMKLLVKLLRFMHLKDSYAALMSNAADPMGIVKGKIKDFTEKQVAPAAGKLVRSAGGAVKNKVAGTRFGRSASRLGRGFRNQIARTRAARLSRSLIHSVRIARQSIVTGVKTTKLFNVTIKLVKRVQLLSQMLNKLVAQLVAKVGVALGWIAVVIIVVVVILTVYEASRKAEKKTGMVDIVTIQDTEIMQEIITELTAKNEAFMAEINNAANHRGSYSSNTGFTANENVSFYEAYHVVFRDSYGNELEPSHVDFNNTKTIISMATRFMPYVFTPLPENPSEDARKTYEDTKQHFKDYCNFLWASTHQISIEEYHPGDSAYSEVDNSGLETDLSTGKCDKEGTTLWLQSDFSPNKVGTTTCSSCAELPDTEYGNYSVALCSHGKNANEVDGWKKTGVSREAINCTKEHHDGCDHSEDDYDCHSCSIGHWHAPHRHLEYEWVYECGGHMGNVVYVTIGELSRFPSLPAAKDVDYGAVAVYPGQEPESTESTVESVESTEESANASESPETVSP